MKGISMKTTMYILASICILMAKPKALDLPIEITTSDVGRISSAEIRPEDEGFVVSGRVRLKRHRKEPRCIAQFLDSSGKVLFEETISLREESKKGKRSIHSMGIARFSQEVTDLRGAVRVTLELKE